MAINNYIKNMQNKIKTTKDVNKMMYEILKAKDVYKNKFIYKSIVKHLNDDKLTLEEAQQFVKDNLENISFKVEKLNFIDEEWIMTISGTTYKTTFKLNTDKEV